MGHFRIAPKPRFQIEAQCKAIVVKLLMSVLMSIKKFARSLVLKVIVLELGRLTESDKIFKLVEQEVLWTI